MNPFMWMIVQPMIVWLIVYAVIFGLTVGAVWGIISIVRNLRAIEEDSN
jgi:uncharacterized membrane protein